MPRSLFSLVFFFLWSFTRWKVFFIFFGCWTSGEETIKKRNQTVYSLFRLWMNVYREKKTLKIVSHGSTHSYNLSSVQSNEFRTRQLSNFGTNLRNFQVSRQITIDNYNINLPHPIFMIQWFRRCAAKKRKKDGSCVAPKCKRGGGERERRCNKL